MPESRHLQVRKLAGNRCDYCRSQESAMKNLAIERILPLDQGGAQTVQNLTLTCEACRSSRHNRLCGVNPETGTRHPLFHPRQHSWPEHFEWNGPLLLGLTDIGRTTVHEFDLNSRRRIEQRRREPNQ